MAKNKIITSEGNVQFQLGDGSGKIINVHPFHIYSVFNEDTVSFILIAMPKSSGLAIFTSKAEDLEVNGTTYTFAELPDALAEAFAVAGAQARAEIVDELPETGQTNTIYLVPKEDGQGFDEYIYIDGQWELLGDTDIELDRYVEKTDFSAYTASTEAKIDGKVQEVTQAEYDSLVSGGTLDPLVLYIITDATPVNMNEYYKKTEVDASQAAQDAKVNTISGDVATVSGQVASEVTRATGAEGALDTKIDTVSGNVDDVQDEVDILSAALEDEVSARTDADSAIQALIDTVSGDVATISGSVESLGDDKANKAEAVASAEYVSSSTTIDLKDISGNVISQVDASDFIIDGMIDDVKIENGYLIIDFNTASGKEDIQIPLTDIFDPSNYYDKTAIDNIVSGLNDSIDTKLDATAYTPTDLTNYYTKSETSGATEIQNALDEKANSGDIKTFVAGRGISITTGATADTIAFNLPVYLSGSSAVAIGQPIGRTQYDNKVSGFSATAIGAGLNSLNSYETATGVHNIQMTNSNAFGNSGNTLFTIGNGAGDGNNYRHNALEVRQNGDIYIPDTNDTSHSEFYKKPMIKLQDALGQGGISSGEVQTMIDNSISGKTNQSDFETYSGAVESRLAEDEEVTAAGLNALNDRLSEDEEVTAAGLNALNDALGGMKLVKLTQTEYDNLSTKDSNTLYVIVN